MKPGKELDQLVLDHVLKLIPCNGWLPMGAYFDGVAKGECGHAVGECHPRGFLPGYSTVPGWSKVILEWLAEYAKEHPGYIWDVHAGFDKKGAYAFCEMAPFATRMRGETVDHAICILALRVAGVEIDFTEHLDPDDDFSIVTLIDNAGAGPEELLGTLDEGA